LGRSTGSGGRLRIFLNFFASFTPRTAPAHHRANCLFRWDARDTANDRVSISPGPKADAGIVQRRGGINPYGQLLLYLRLQVHKRLVHLPCRIERDRGEYRGESYGGQCSSRYDPADAGSLRLWLWLWQGRYKPYCTLNLVALQVANAPHREAILRHLLL